jgi:hypothetical protein
MTKEMRKLGFFFNHRQKAFRLERWFYAARLTNTSARTAIPFMSK